MLRSLKWAVWALILPFLLADAHQVKWEDLMIATDKFPRFSGLGEVDPDVDERGSPKVVAYRMGGKAEPVKCFQGDGGQFRCDFVDCGDCETVHNASLDATRLFQGFSPNQLNDLTFIGDSVLYGEEDGWHRRSFLFKQTNLGGTIEIDNTIVKYNLDTRKEDGKLFPGGEPNRYLVYTGEFDQGSSTPPCGNLKARDRATEIALQQPFWEALYPWKEHKLVYTVQDGRLYLTWRLTFNLKDKVSDDFIVWVNARDCNQIVAAAPAEMDLYTKSLKDFHKAQKELAKARGLKIVRGPGKAIERID